MTMTIKQAFDTQAAVYCNAEPIAHKLVRTYRAFRIDGYTATEALRHARNHAEGRYPHYHHKPVIQRDGMTYLGDTPENFGLRFVGYAQAEARNYYSPIDTDKPRGWYVNDYEESCYGVVYQLPGHDGKLRYVAGIDFSDRDGGLQFDLRRIFTENRRDGSSYDGPNDIDAACDAARAGDQIAKREAESEREYSQAWRAGSDWAQEGETIDAIKVELKAILAERKVAKASNALFPALCGALRAQVTSLWNDIQEARERRSELIEGDCEHCHFWPGDKRLQSAFNEGADAEAFLLSK